MNFTNFDLERTVQLITALVILYEKAKKIVKSIGKKCKKEKQLKKEGS